MNMKVVFQRVANLLNRTGIRKPVYITFVKLLINSNFDVSILTFRKVSRLFIPEVKSSTLTNAITFLIAGKGHCELETNY